MTSVEKRRSSRKSSGHRKHSDGGFSDTSSGGSFLDETDREVSNLTDRAFRSLCIGDEAVYNDSDLSWSSPSAYSDRQLAFCRDREEREREDRKRAAQENFNFSVQQYGKDWITTGMYGAEIQREAQWEAYGDRTQGMVSATFQHSLVETSQLGKSLREEELSFHSNGATELSSQQRRSQSRVSSLIRAFNSDGHRDVAGAEDNIREQDDGTSWDKSALMSIQRELSEFSYQQNFNHHFHPAGPFSCRDPNFFSSEAEAVAQMSHSYMRSSQTKHIMSAQANCNSNFFIHSEFSPFQLWRDYNRFPFQQAEVSGFMHYSEFPKWYQTPMYNELSLENQAHGRHGDIRQPRNHLGYPLPLTAPRSISTSSQFQRASAVEKRCESELTVYHPHRKCTQSLGTNKLPPHRPSTASPSTEMSRRVRDTIGSVKALQQKVKMMSEYDTTNQQEAFSTNESWFNSGKNVLTAEMNIVGSNKANSFRIGQQLTPSVQQHQDLDTSCLQQHEVSPQPVEHPPVRAESRGATPDVRMSSYRSRATSLLFNLKDNRKRVKSTYSPTKFKGSDTLERNQLPYGQEQHKTAFTSSDVQCLQPEALRSANAATNQYHTPGLSLTAQTSHPTRVNTGHYSENTVNDYQVAQMQSHGSGFSGFATSNYSNNHLLGNGQNPNKYFASFTPYRQDIYGSTDEVKQSYSAEDTTRPSVDNNQHRAHPTGKANATQRGVFVKVDRYEQLEENKHNYTNVSSSHDDWRQASVQDTENIHLKTNVPPVKHETMSLVERLKQDNLHGGEKELVKDANLKQNYNSFTDQYGRGQQNIISDKTIDMIKTSQTKLNIPASNENILTNPQFEKKNQPNPTFIEENASIVAMTNQAKNMQTVDTKCEQVMASHRKPHYPQVEMAKTQQNDHAEPPKTEIAKFISSRQPAFETVKMQELHNVRQAKDDHIIQVEERKNEQKEKSRDTYFQQEEEKQMKGDKERVLKLTDEPTNVTEKVPKKLKTEQAEKEKLKEEHIKTELAKTEAPEQVRIDQVKHEQANGMQAGEKQQSTEKAEGEQMDAEKINMEKVKEEQIKDEQREQIKELQTKTIDVKKMGMEVLEVKTDHMKVEDVRECRDEKDSSHACQINVEKATSGTCSTEDTRGEKTKLEENLEQKESEQSKTENLLERSAKLTAKLAATQQARQEPDRVEQVKTELAKAKAELAKIKEKMRGEQKEKVRNILFTKEEVLLKNDNSNTGENTDNKNQNHPLEIQTHAVTDDYERLREKYGFTHPTSANSTKVSVAEHNKQAKENKVEIENNVLSIDRPCVGDTFLTPETENKEGGRNFKHGNETVQESDCNEPLSKPQFGSCHSLLTNSCDKANRENVSEKLKDDSGQKSEKIDVIKGTVSLEKYSVSANHEKKSTDQRINAGKDMAVAPLRALSQREKAQFKQEILTSKIKAHAEKEISAIKEKGFAVPEGFIGKSSAMLLASGQSVNIRQRPSSQEVPKQHETTVSNKIAAKHQLELSGVQKETGKSASSLSSDTVGGEAAADHSEKSTKIILPTGTSVSTTNICGQNEKMEANHTETSGRLSGETQQVENDETLTETKDLAHSMGLSKPVTAEAAKEEAHKDSESEDCVTQNETSVRDDSVLIMGIMVTVVERNPTVNSGPQNSNTEKQTNSVKAESNTSDSGTENSSQEEAEVLVKTRDSKESPCVMKENEDSLGKNNFSDNAKETLNWKEINREISAENADLQLNNRATNAELQKKRQSEVGSVPSKDKFLAKTQPILHQMDTTLENTKDVSVNMPKENVSETSGHPESGDEGSQHEMQKPLFNEMSHDKANKAENDLPMKDDATTVRNISKSSNNDEYPSPVPEDNTCSYTPPSPFNDSCTDNTGIVSQNQQSTETFSEEHDQEDSVHIDNIAIRVVPTESKKDNVDMLEKCDMKAVPPNVGFASEQSQVVPSGSEGKPWISNHGHHFENSIEENSEQKMKDSLEEKLAVQYVLSSVRKLSDSLKASEKQNNANTTMESITAGDKKSESSVQLVEADYFQVQGLAETSNTSPNDITAGKDSKGKDVLKLLSNGTVIGTELHKKQQSDVFVFTVDPSEQKTDQSSSEITDGENLTSKNLETGDNTATSKQPGGSMESWNKIKNADASQSNPTRTYNEVNQLESCATERQNSGNQNLTSTHSGAKPNPRERVSAIPEISAIADYARLKVIVSEDKEEQPLQQYPPNKKEGFFPLIQTRHTRRPVFTDDPPDRSVKTQSLPSKTEITATVNKESKSLVFAIMEREHQRTGMFKLGDKERQEKTALNAQMTLYIDKDPNQIDTKNSPTDKTELVAQATEERQWRTVEEEQQMKVPHEIQRRGPVEEQYRRTTQQKIAEKEQQKKALHEKQQRRVAEEQRRRTEEEEQRRKAAYEEQQRKAAEEQRRKAAQLEQKRRIAEEQQRKALHEEQQRRIAEEQQRRIEEEEQRRKAAYKEQQRKAAEEQQRRAAQLEQQRRIAEEEQQRKAEHEEQRRLAEEQQKRTEEEKQRRKATFEEQQKREAEEQQKRFEEEEQRRKAAYEEQQRKAVEEQRKIIEEEERRRKAAYEEQQRREAEEQQKRAAQLEQQRWIAEKEKQRKAAYEEQQRREAEEQRKRIEKEEQRRKAAYEEQQRKAAEEQQRRAAQLEHQRRIAEEEQQRKAAHKEQQRRLAKEKQMRIAQEEQQRRAAEEEQQRIEEEQRKKAAHEEQQRQKAEEQQRRAALLEEKRKIAEEQQWKAAEQQKKTEEEEQRRKSAYEEQQRKAAEKKQRRITEEEQRKMAVHEELQRRAAERQQLRDSQFEHQRRIAKKEQQTKVSHEQQSLAVEEQLRRAGQLEQTRRLREGPQMRKTAQEEQEERTVQQQKRETEQQQRKLSQEDKQMILSAEEQNRGELDEQERKAKHEEQQRRVAQKEKQQSDVEEHRKRLAQEKQQRIASLIEEQRQVKQVKEQIVSNTEKETKGEGINVFISEKESVKQTQELNRIQQRNEEPMNESLVEEEKNPSRKMLKNENIAAEKEEIMGELRTEKHFKQDNAKESTPTKKDNNSQANKMDDDEQVSSLRVKALDRQEMDKGTAQKTDALQYFAITPTNRDKRSREKQLFSPSPLQQQNKKDGELESPNDLLYQRQYRPHAAASPAPTLPRSNTSSPAPGAKPLMFRVKDNTIRGSSLTKSVKPRFHKNFGEDFLMGSTFDGASDKAEDDQEIIRRNAGTPLSRFATISESAALFSPSSLQDYSSTTPHLRPYSRRSMATDDDESRSIISSMSEDVESFATSAADLTEMHGLFDFDRPESACSFSSDVSRSLGKPPAVPPKSEKALQRAQRLTSRRMKKELSKPAEGNPVGVGKEVSSFPSSSSSSSNEVCSSNHHVVASPHFSPPVAFALAPATGSSLPSSLKDRKSSHRSFHASPHATGPISIPSPSPHAGSAVSLHASSPASKPAALQTVAHVSSSPTLHHVSHPATPLTQYHVESTNYPLTQRKVLQDLGSGQFFVVDVPVQVKTKTFFDPETGKYVQLNVRQTGQNISQPQLQQKYQQPQVQQELQVKQQPQRLSSVTTPASKPFRFCQGYHSSPQNYQAAVVNSVHGSSSSVPAALHQSQEASRENHSSRTPVPEIDQNSEGHRYSPEKTPYMDTVNDITKTCNLVNSTRDSCNPFPECDTNSPLGRSSVSENNHSANLEYQPRDIIAISELEDFMEVSDW